MEFKDYYATLGVERTATRDEIQRAYRKLARKSHPDLNQEPGAEARFKEVTEAREVLIDPERRAAYDDIGQRHERGQPFEPPPGWDSGYEFSGRGDDAAQNAGQADFSAFFESLFGRTNGHDAGRNAGRAGGGPRPRHPTDATFPEQGADHHAKVEIDLIDAYLGAQRSISLRVPVIDAQGRATLLDRRLDVNIPKGVREGQHLRLSGQGGNGQGGAPAGDLYLEIRFRPHPGFRIDGRDVTIDLPVTPSEAALGSTLTVSTPDSRLQLTIPPGSGQGRKLRLKGKGLPGSPPGDLYAVLGIVLPPASTEEAKEAYRALARTFPDFNPRAPQEA